MTRPAGYPSGDVPARELPSPGAGARDVSRDVTTITERLRGEVDRMQAAMVARVAADAGPTFAELVRSLVEATEQAKTITDPAILAALLAARARRGDPCESCGCDGDCRVMP